MTYPSSDVRFLAAEECVDDRVLEVGHVLLGCYRDGLAISVGSIDDRVVVELIVVHILHNREVRLGFSGSLRLQTGEKAGIEECMCRWWQWLVSSKAMK